MRALGQSGLLAATVAAMVIVGGCGAGKSGADKPVLPSVRATPPIALLQDYAQLKAHPVRTLQIMRSLGVGAARVLVAWSWVATDPNSHRRPRGNPYPAKAFAWYDRLDRVAKADGIQLDFLVTGQAPEWALARNDPNLYAGTWKPSDQAFRQFVATVGARYSGHYTPSGALSPLPRVHFWELWNEPNWGPSLEPQFGLHPVRNTSPSEYRGLLDGAWTALTQTGHGHDTVVIGNLSPRGSPGPPPSARQALAWNTSPVSFTRALYCVGRSYRPLRGSAAALVGCPTTATASRQFRADHPVLFEATGYGVHPYPINLPPTESDSSDPDTIEFSTLPHLENVLDRVHGAYGSNSRMHIYNTEYGYVTNPPNPGPVNLSPARAAVYLNWAEYITWRNPRMANFMQYGLHDAYIPHSVFGRGGFATALILPDGTPKATFYSYRLPIFLPVSSASRGSALEVWGCARPAPFAYADTHRAQSVQIQFRAGNGRAFRTVRTVRLRPAHGCYFDVAVKFPATGTVRLQWSYPHGDPRLADPANPDQTTIYSREVPIKLG